MPNAPQMERDAARVADATARNWVDRFAPARARPWLRLARADRPAGTWLLLLPCWWGATLAGFGTGWDARLWWVLIGCGLGALVMRGAGCTWNDMTDREFDAQVARTRSRPIPSGQVSLRGAFMWLGAQLLLGLLILLSFNGAAVLTGITALGFVAIYPFAKRFTWWPQVFLGLAFNWGALFAPVAVLGYLPAFALPLYLSGICWTLVYDTIYAHQDREDDALIGVRSTARLFGAQTGRWLSGFALAATLLMICAVWITPGAPTLALLAPLAFGAHLSWQLLRLDIDDTETCLKLFRANRDTGLIPPLVFAMIALIG